MKIMLMIFFGFGAAAALGLLVAAPAYYAGKFIRRHALDDKYYRQRGSQLATFLCSTPVVACAALVVGITVDWWYESTIVFSFAWGALLGLLSLESFADFASRLPKEPKPQDY